MALSPPSFTPVRLGTPVRPELGLVRPGAWEIFRLKDSLDLMELIIISALPHYLVRDRVVGIAPVSREIDYLSDLFGEVRHIAFLHSQPAPANMQAYESGRVQVVPLEPSGGLGIAGKLGVLCRAPSYARLIRAAVQHAALVHVRCPSSVSLQAMLLLAAARRPPRSWIKYGGDWRPSGPEPLANRVQRMILRKGWSNSVVSVNGAWPRQPPHVYSFLNPSFSLEEARRAIAATADKHLESPVRLFFAARLSPGKGAVRALRVLSTLVERGIDATLDVAGEGPEGGLLRRLIDELGLSSRVQLHGWLTPVQMRARYEYAHFALLPSRSEGWPKVLSEAMAYGAVPVAGAVSCIREVLARTGTGVACPPDEIRSFADAIEDLVREPARWAAYRRNGHASAALFTFEAYVDQVRRMLGQAPKPISVAAAAGVPGSPAFFVRGTPPRSLAAS
jgi:glycosyltransferase involved in cell wall biosynthesis